MVLLPSNFDTIPACRLISYSIRNKSRGLILQNVFLKGEDDTGQCQEYSGDQE